MEQTKTEPNIADYVVEPEQKPDILKTDLAIVALLGGVVIGSYLLGKRAGMRNGYIAGTMHAYESILGSI